MESDVGNASTFGSASSSSQIHNSEIRQRRAYDVEAFATLSPDRQADFIRHINNITQSVGCLKNLLPLEPLGDDEPSGDDPSGNEPTDDEPPPNNGFWQSIFDFLANVWGSIKSTFQNIFEMVISGLVKIYESLGNCVHQIKESIRDMISALQQLFQRRGYSTL